MTDIQSKLDKLEYLQSIGLTKYQYNTNLKVGSNRIYTTGKSYCRRIDSGPSSDLQSAYRKFETQLNRVLAPCIEKAMEILSLPSQDSSARL